MLLSCGLLVFATMTEIDFLPFKCMMMVGTYEERDGCEGREKERMGYLVRERREVRVVQ